MSTTHHFPELDPATIAATRDALHAYSLVLGDFPAACRPKRKHWWHISLRPALNGMTTDVIRAPGHLEPVDFELELDPTHSLVRARTSNGAELTEPLHGQPASALAETVSNFLTANGLNPSLIPPNPSGADMSTAGYSSDAAASLAAAWRAISTAMETFRAGIPEETSPVQLWPHHFDLAMMWLPGEKIPGQDPEDEENSDKQMNFGFTFGDTGISEPYFYITAYPLPDAFPALPLPAGTAWHSDGFSGAVLRYQSLVQSADPQTYLLELWNALLTAGRSHMLTKKT